MSSNLDVKIKTEDFEFKFRACGIVICKGKILVVRIKENTFFAMPGGHVELGENTQNATLREMKEETGLDLKIEKLIAITENFFDHKGKKLHELAYYYIMTPQDESQINLEDKLIMENDKGEIKKLSFHWWNPDEEKDIDLKPVYIKNKLLSKNYDFENVIIND